MGNFVVIMAAKSCRYNDLEKILLDQNTKPCNLPLQWLQDITSDFSPQRELGRGAFGVVYKRVLRNGQVIAVKKLKELVPGIHDRQFENEVFNLMRLKHKNIVRLIGYCYDIQKIFFEHEGRFILADNQQRLLCLEFLPGGTLEKHLAGESPGLDWHKRYKIIMGICCGLHYLHEQWGTRTPIVHLDLKTCKYIARL
ncbi:hypothetical protein QOZ80_6AG0545650 [Eleusine coracana subsp. coracana]|nr:hypothetical protein QOZ80_6AG0545650 [Eleusine coracana subsp. coracana]